MNTLLERDFVRTQLGEFGLDPSLVLYLPLWKKDGDLIRSDDAHGHLCTVTGATWGSQGRTFDGASFISIPNASSLKFGSVDFSVEFWIYRTDNRDIIGMYTYPEADGWGFSTNNVDRMRLYCGGAAFALLNLVDYNARWCHFVLHISHSDDTIYCYQDGVLGGSIAFVDQTFNSTLALTIGKFTIFQFGSFVGKIGEVRIYNRGISLVEARHNYLATKWRYQ